MPIPIRISLRQIYTDPTGSGSTTLVTGINAQIIEFLKLFFTLFIGQTVSQIREK